MFVTSGLFTFQGEKTVVIWRRTTRKGVRAICLLALVLAACGGGGSSGTGSPDLGPGAVALRLERINVSLSFPVFAISPDDGSGRLFVVEKNGVIKIVNLATQQLLPTPFLDLTGQIATGGEQGLLGLAFHPNFSLNGYFYVNVVTQTGFTEIRRYQVSSGNPNVADPLSLRVIIRVDQRLPSGALFSNHKAGWLDFSPGGFLYIALGDGGSGGDPENVAQNRDILLGKMLRLNVDADEFPGDDARNYAIPAGNPFVGVAGADEIWALGLRNPWRASFDRGTGDLYIADVGQGAREEVNVATAASGGGNGVNYGWDIMEGTSCFTAPCNVPNLTPPVLEYDHSGGGCSITGGYVYRGTAITALQGTYFYADYCLGFVRSFRFVNGNVTEQSDWATLDPPNENITSFGEDRTGELYIVTQQGGLYRIVPN